MHQNQTEQLAFLQAAVGLGQPSDHVAADVQDGQDVFVAGIDDLHQRLTYLIKFLQ